MRATIFVVLTALCAACASSPPAELVSARQSYDRARTGPAAQLAPEELARSRSLLQQAEHTYADSSGSRRVRDFAYAADKQAQRAETVAQVELAKQDKAAAERELTVAESEVQRRADQSVAQSQAQAMSAEARAEAERAARLAGERARAAMVSLGKSASIRDESRGTVVSIAGDVMFAPDGFTLLNSADGRLDNLAVVQRAHPESDVLIEVYGDANGSEEYKAWLRNKRAESVRSSLIVRGIPAERIRVSSPARPMIPGGAASVDVIFTR